MKHDLNRNSSLTSMNRVELTRDAIDKLAREPRACLINSLPGFKPAMLVGTVDKEDRTNLAIISSLFHIGSNPPLLGMLLRPSSERSQQHTLCNLIETENYTLNSFAAEEAAKAHHTSARFPKGQSEFDACGFDVEWVSTHKAPFILNSSLQIGCKLIEHQELLVNGTHLIIGEIVLVRCWENALGDDGGLDLNRLGLMIVSGLDSYHVPGPASRFSPARPNLNPKMKFHKKNPKNS